ncbi:MAG: hypothetical protein C0591_03660 [Marinilabiliales bacterium]|nr:MAG: hypothetical protein C0591_03660 [Marinilabiliales bacterium]
MERNMKHLYFFIICCIFMASIAQAQTGNDSNKKAAFFIQPELLIGKALPSNSNFPKTELERIFSVSFGKYIQDTSLSWSVFYNYPSVGISVTYSNFGKNDVFGNAYSVIPFIAISTSKKQAGNFYFKIGLGASYFTKFYNEDSNPYNLAIGSTFTWAFESTLHYNIYVTPVTALSIGGGFIHHSNGHTQLPNLGLNSLLFSFTSRFYLKPLNDQQLFGLEKPIKKQSRNYFISVRNGLGYHVLGGAMGSIDDQKRIVQSISASGGIIFNQLVKVGLGMTYRFYQQYHNYLNLIQTSGMSENDFWNSSNIFVFVGCELFLGHVSMDSEIGINLFKPFYEEFNREFEDDSEFKYQLKMIFATRLGLKVYAVSTSRNPKNNVYIGAHINANFLQADFSELSIGYVYRFSKTN